MSETGPLVSVVIPTYNRADLVGRAIRSVQEQTFKDWELIVVDDASTDNTEEVVSSFADTRIRYHRHQTNRGGSAARNTGIRKSKGEYISFLDSDDEWLSNKLQKQLRVFESAESEVGLVYTGMIHQYSDGSKFEITPSDKGDLTRSLLIRNVVGSSSVVLVRSDVLEQVGGFDEYLPARQDIDMWLRVSKEYLIDCTEGCLAVIYKEEDRDRLSKDNWGRCKGYIGFYNKHKKLLAKENLSQVYLCQMGRVFEVRGNRTRVARMCYFRSIDESPFYVYAYVLLVATYSPVDCRRIIPGSIQKRIFEQRRVAEKLHS